ncbi:hypothetical protein [Ruegeria intermedia]|uniref:hypothetical protein n=1 Tax=Ruegeria intermedia TaxID=996115 RepID=UPI00165EDE00|nr:hypothetical protein [Ruegeria intermedia]
MKSNDPQYWAAVIPVGCYPVLAGLVIVIVQRFFTSPPQFSSLPTDGYRALGQMGKIDVGHFPNFQSRSVSGWPLTCRPSWLSKAKLFVFKSRARSDFRPKKILRKRFRDE